MKVEFTVRGEPAPKGSKNAYCVNFPKRKQKNFAAKIRAVASKLLANPHSWFPHIVVSEVSKRVGPWEKDIREKAEIAMASHESLIPAFTPVRLVMIFFLKRPASHFGTGKNADVIKDRFKDAMPLKTPDLSKLFRAAEDGLNKVVFDDDFQVVEMVGKKLYGRKNGVRIIVEPVTFREVKNSEPEQLLLFDSEDLK